jgi:hypothetical protein
MIKYAICDELRKLHRKKRSGQVFSLNATQENGREWLDAISDPNANEAYTLIEENIGLAEIITNKEIFTETEYEVFQQLVGNRKVDEIAETMGVSQRKTRLLITGLKSKVYSLLGRSEPMTTRRTSSNVEKENTPVNTVLDLAEFITFNAFNSVSNRACCSINVGKSGRVTLSSAIGATYKIGTKLEVLINKKSNIIVVRQSENGIKCRINGGLQGYYASLGTKFCRITT